MQKLLLLVGLCVLVAHLEATCSRNLVCTFQNNSNFNMADDMEPLLCTHIIFKSFQPNAMVIPQTGGPIQDHHDFNLAFPSATAKTLLEVDLTGITIFTASNRDTFITSVIDVVDAAGFDGVNILWSQSEDTNQNKIRFTALMQELKDELGGRLLTASVSGVPSEITASYQVSQLLGVVNFFNVMTGDLDRTSTSGQFPLAMTGMQKWVTEGAQKAKLNMGIATYGYDTNNANTRIWAKYQVCDDNLLPPTTVEIDNNPTIGAKAHHIVDRNFGGAYVTSLELDDFDGVCNAGNYPVFRRIKAIISN
ncbi:acidic mammalian chitinase-like [Hippocampus comes]|uniref:acidic mammalian chitinase-like n=1 Tax=Hippocampus comes TaxID=109280 RepID=UPI00094E6CC5|nr:PREDICTED: acidic mammalian chitinase-like [Hippocampus comes]